MSAVDSEAFPIEFLSAVFCSTVTYGGNELSPIGAGEDNLDRSPVFVIQLKVHDFAVVLPMINYTHARACQTSGQRRRK